MKLSIVTTLYYSAPYIKEFYQRICNVADAIAGDYEIVFVNDGSPDEAVEIAIALYKEDERVRVIDLSRNFGHHKAMMTGLMYAQGDLIFLIDVDLEEPPELLMTFYKEFRHNNVDVVYGVQSARHGSWFNRISGSLFYHLFNWLSDHPVPPSLLTARLMSQRYVKQLIKHKEHLFNIEGLWEITGFKQIPVAVNKEPYKGTTTYNFSRKLTYAINAITAFSNKPLRGIAYLGLFIIIPSSIYIIYLLIGHFLFNLNVYGWTALLVSLWFIAGLIIFILGIIATYISVILTEIKNRPYTIVRQFYNHDNYPLYSQAEPDKES
jgi:putative glycosyltransferase